MTGPRATARLAAALAAGWVVAGAAQAEECRLALALALDVSSSVDAREYRLQTEGLAAALVAPEVAEAFLAVPGRPVRILVYEWSGWHQQVVRQDWVTVAGLAELAGVASRLAAQDRSFEQYPTALGMGLLFGARELARQPDCASGSSTCRATAPTTTARRPTPSGATCRSSSRGSPSTASSSGRTRGCSGGTTGVRGAGPGAFVEAAEDYSDRGGDARSCCASSGDRDERRAPLTAAPRRREGRAPRGDALSCRMGATPIRRG